MVARLPDGFRDFVGLAESESDAALLVADDNQRAEAEAASAFDDLGERLMKTSFSISSACSWPANAPVFTKAPFSGFSGSTGAVGARRARGVLERVSAAIILEVEPAFAGGIGKCFHFAVVNETAAVEDDFRHVLRLRALGHEFADRGCRHRVGFRILRL